MFPREAADSDPFEGTGGVTAIMEREGREKRGGRHGARPL